MNYNMTLTKFLQTYYNIPSGKSKYLRHKDFRKLMPNLIFIPNSEDEIQEKMKSGMCIRIKDCEGRLAYYLNPINEYSKTTYSFEKSEEFINSPMYYRFVKYENLYDEYYNSVDTELQEIYEQVQKIDELDKWELLELRKKVNNNNKITMNRNYFILSLIKKELSNRRKIDRIKQKIYKSKKGDINYD